MNNEIKNFIHFLKKENAFNNFKHDYIYNPNKFNRKNIFTNIEMAYQDICLDTRMFSPLDTGQIGFWWHDTNRAEYWSKLSNLFKNEKNKCY